MNILPSFSRSGCRVVIFLFQVEDGVYYTYQFNPAKFIKEMNDWLYFRTEDVIFKTKDEPKPKGASSALDSRRVHSS